MKNEPTSVLLFSIRIVLALALSRLACIAFLSSDLFAFVPLLYINEQLGFEGIKFWPFAFYTYTALLLFNGLTTWWVWNSTAAGALFMLFANSLLMLIPWLAYRYTTYRMKMLWWSHFSIIPYFIAFEYWHLNWELSWPWLTLGNAAALFPETVQWYEYTGVLGGSFWILISNVIVFLCYIYYNKKRHRYKSMLYLAFSVIMLPALYSYLRYLTYEEEGTGKEIVVVQPNIDPYTQKYPGRETSIPYAEQFKRLQRFKRRCDGSQYRFCVMARNFFS